ncbi:MAG TPA: transcriptional regulator [Syntrophomonas sp.]|jgi:transcriptional regulator with XRE-family HTH domain|nr:transcriptional regulator [Syntrophomonas sp.]
MNLRIRDMREDADLTQQQVAEYLMCDQSLYSKYERGERPVPLEIIVKLAHLYQTSVDYLVGLTNKKHLIEEYEHIYI